MQKGLIFLIGPMRPIKKKFQRLAENYKFWEQ
jgi:hypothetical protein